ncbi:MAG: DUF1934 domain-containing protein [Clostridiales Family XIII bacterium]|jgi:uncharacterized beta-barrel protein YwiB (DUF1934 family)|nr:DUF1934 domain-containing protein [Clostridiales Family XIII bacterium]
MKDILLKIIGSQWHTDGAADVLEDGADADPGMEFITEGRFYKRGPSVYLVYDESDFSGAEGCTTSLRITGDKIRMKRYGEDVPDGSSIEFEKGKRFSGWYETPFGSVEMEVLTNDIDNRITAGGEGSLDIDYHVSLKGLTESRSRLSIEILQ